MSRPSLIEQVQGLLERTYDLDSQRVDIGRFVIGDAGYRRFYKEGQAVRHVGSSCRAASLRSHSGGSRVLLRESDEGVRAAVYLPDRLIACLEEHPPQRGLSERNVDAFATMVEELDHLLCIADRAARDQPVSMFELELQANVSKYLVLARFLASAAGRLSERRRTWLRFHLFEKLSFVENDPRVRQRYRDARRFAVRFLDRMAPLPMPILLDVLRRFHQASTKGKLQLIDGLGAY